MSYLYGDSTLSKLEVNYIELLRDAVDCCVQVLLADQRIGEGAARTRRTPSTGRRPPRSRSCRTSATWCPKYRGCRVGEPASATARCLAAIVRSAADIVGAATAEATATLQSAVSRRDADAALERALVVRALETLLIKHDLPDMKSDADVGLVGGTRYACRLRLATPFGLVALMEQERAGGAPPRAGRPRRSPGRAAGGAGARDVRLAAQRGEAARAAPGEAPPDRGFRRGAAGELRLRLGPDGAGSGYDIVFAEPGEPVRLVRVDEQQKREKPFEAQEADAAKLCALRDKVAAAVAELARHRTKILDAKLEGEALANHAQPSLLVERIIAQLVPEAREIAARSQSVGELVLRRALGGDRREEIFLSKQDLKAKLEPLNDRNRALFDGLLDGGPVSGAEPPPAPPRRIEPPATPPPPDGLGAALLRKTLLPTVIPTGTPAMGVPVRPPTPLYGVPSLTPAAASPTATLSPPPPPPPAPAASARPTPPSEPAATRGGRRRSAPAQDGPAGHRARSATAAPSDGVG